ncbi:MAG: MoaD/ThiS family protein [Chloroflexi bacterium]|nr:MoaD/ThiS family protein [Chloroflexota bacterium]
MKVSFYATLRQIVGSKTVDIPVASGITVRALIDEVAARYPRLRPELLGEDGNLLPHVHVLVNGRDAPYLRHGLETVLGPDDTFALFPPVAGGAGSGR